MSETDEARGEEEIDDAALEAQEAEMRSLLRGAGVRPATADAPSLLPAVQRKIRQRSRGKFFADGWSTAQPRVSYVLIAMIMLLVVVVAYFALGPTGFH